MLIFILTACTIAIKIISLLESGKDFRFLEPIAGMKSGNCEFYAKNISTFLMKSICT